MKLHKIINELLEKYEGGEVYFDNLDQMIRSNKWIMEDVLMSIPKGKRRNIVLSGRFGNVMLEFKKEKSFLNQLTILVEGGLRKGNTINLSNISNLIKGEEFIFIDDSFYLGRTRDTIKNEIEKYGGKLTDTYVVYDGSHTKEDNVHSLYRYYK